MSQKGFIQGKGMEARGKIMILVRQGNVESKKLAKRERHRCLREKKFIHLSVYKKQVKYMRHENEN